MVGPRVELEPWIGLRHELREPAGRVRVGLAVHAAVAAVRGGLADRHLRLRVAALDAGVGRRIQLRVQLGAYRAALQVELRREEELEVRLVPDGVEAHERKTGVAAGVPRRECPGEVRQIGVALRQDVRLLASVRPLGGAPDGQEHLHAALLGAAHELVEVVEPVGRIERVGGVPRPFRGDVRPGYEGAHDRGVGSTGLVEHSRPVLLVAEVGIVVESDVHARVAEGEGGRQQAHDTGRDQELDESLHR